MHHRVTRTARARRRSGRQKRPSGAFLERGRVPRGVVGVKRRGVGEWQGLEMKSEVFGNTGLIIVRYGIFREEERMRVAAG